MLTWTRSAMRWVCAAGVSLAVCGCGPRRESLTVAGSTAFQPFAEKLADQYLASHPEINITVQGGGSAMGIQAALSGAADVGMADMVQLPANAASLTATTVAQDGIVVVVNPANGVKNLTIDQIRGLFSGAIGNWKEVGGADQPVTVVSREEGSGTRSSFEQILGGVRLSGNAIVQNSNGTIRETVANDANAVGYLSHGLLNDKIRAVTVAGVECTAATIAAGTYRLVRPIFLLTQGVPAGVAKAFIDYILSPDGQQTITNSGLLPVKTK